MSLLSWKLHGNGKSVSPGAVVSTDERLTWPRTIGVGLQHIAAMFGATFLVPIITGFPPTTTLFFSGIGTLIFLALTQNKVPSYLGSSFAFLAPIAAAKTSGGMGAALGGVVVTGVILAVVGLIVRQAGIGWINWMLPPVVTGTIVMVIGLNLAGAAKNNFVAAPMIGVITLASIGLISAFSRGFMGRISVFLGLLIGYLVAYIQGDVNTDGIKAAKWFALPTFTNPTFDGKAIILFLPVVLVLIAENVGHVKAVASMTGKDLDDQMGTALMADGVATTLAGFGGGSGTTTYAENIGVMAATREAGFGPEVKRRIILGTYALSSGYYDDYYGSAQKVRTLIQRDFEAAFAKADVLVSPTAPTTAFKLGEKIEDPLAMYLNDIATIPANLAGIPGLSLPNGLADEDQLPSSIQLLAPAREDKRLYSVGAVLEKAHENVWGKRMIDFAPEVKAGA